MKSTAILNLAGRATAFLALCGLFTTTAFAADGNWTGTTSGAWLTTTNWTGGIVPGSQSTTTNTDVATFAVTAQSTAGINMATTLNNYYLGALVYNTTAARTVNNSSTSQNGVLTLNGATVNSVANTIIRHTGSNTFTIADGTSRTMGVALGNATDNIVAIDSTGNVQFSSIVSGAGRHITVQGSGTGRLLLTGQNTYSGGTLIKAGATLSANGISSTGAGPVTSGPLGTGSLTIDGGTFIPTSSGINTIGNAIILNTPSSGENSISAGGGPATLSGNISGTGGFGKGSSGILILSGTNSYQGVTNVNSGTLAIAKKVSFYNGQVANWIDTNFAVKTNATLVFGVGGAGEISLAEFLNLATVGSNTGGFLDQSNIGIDTTLGGDQTISTVIANTNAGANRLGFVKSGTGTVTLSAANTFGGATTVVGGTLKLTDSLALQKSNVIPAGVVFDQTVASNAFTFGGLTGSSALALQNNGSAPIALTVGNNNESVSYSGAISGPSGASLVKIGTGAQSLSGTNTFNGGVNLSAGRLNINSATALGTGTFTIGDGTTIDNSTGANITNTNNNAQTWSGGFTFVGTRALVMGTGAVTMNGATNINVTGTNSNNNALRIGGVISGSGALTKSGPGRLYLTGQSTFGGGVTITGGVVHTEDSNSNLPTSGPLGTGTLQMVAGQLIGSSGLVADQTISNPIDLVGAPEGNELTTNAKLHLTGIISGVGGFTKTGNATNTLYLANANTYQGNTIIGSTSGTLMLAHQLAAQNSTVVTNSTATLAFDSAVAGNAFTIGGLSGNGNVALQNSAAAAIDLTVGNNNANTTYTGVVSGPGNFIKAGGGVTTLNGNNTYSGTTTVNAGKLLVNGNHTGGGTYTVNAGGTLGGAGTIGSNVALAGGTLAPGNSINTLSIGGSVTLTSGTFDWEFNGGSPTPVGADADVMNVAGTLSINSAVALVGTNLGASILTGTKFVAISYQNNAFPGTFNSAPDDTFVLVGGKTFLINYNDTSFGAAANAGRALYGNAVTLTAVPEVSSIVVMGLCGMLAIGMVWLGKRSGQAKTQTTT